MAYTVTLADILPEWMDLQAARECGWLDEASTARHDDLTRQLGLFKIEVELPESPTEMASALSDAEAYRLEQAAREDAARGGQEPELPAW
jgi:hypothetical protein|tara:strand:- start:114 stop:383 length:270 start_codon:yes stop_codon:yes gene_type:complete